jgi:hypothetical protein
MGLTDSASWVSQASRFPTVPSVAEPIALRGRFPGPYACTRRRGPRLAFKYRGEGIIVGARCRAGPPTAEVKAVSQRLPYYYNGKPY